ncbi:hypothetical protein HY483_00470 [Candidatus Woesearchaeota archaeon]|nr:hypothetical protein [Candidatus Woesearchaeota archaeon]
MRKGEMNWVIISMVIGLIALVLIVVLLSNSFRSAGENTGCVALGGECVLLDSAGGSSSCAGAQRTFTNDCRLADKQVCCVKPKI